MKKIIAMNWITCKKYEIGEMSLHDIIDNFLEIGYNIMIDRRKDCYIVWVDKKTFRQR